MTKIFKLNGLDCANCAAKVERRVGKIKAVKDANVDFMSLKMIVDLSDFNQDIMSEIEKAVHKVDKNIDIVEL